MDGYEYWVGQLNNGMEDRSELLLGFAESAENKLLFSEITGFHQRIAFKNVDEFNKKIILLLNIACLQIDQILGK